MYYIIQYKHILQDGLPFCVWLDSEDTYEILGEAIYCLKQLRLNNPNNFYRLVECKILDE
jgi:hypothetical protein